MQIETTEKKDYQAKRKDWHDRLIGIVDELKNTIEKLESHEIDAETARKKTTALSKELREITKAM